MMKPGLLACTKDSVARDTSVSNVGSLLEQKPESAIALVIVNEDIVGHMVCPGGLAPFSRHPEVGVDIVWTRFGIVPVTRILRRVVGLHQVLSDNVCNSGHQERAPPYETEVVANDVSLM